MKNEIKFSLSGVKRYCFRLLNGTSTVGCQSELSGNMGAISVVEKLEDIDKQIRSLPYGISKIIAVVDSRRFVDKLISELRDNQAVGGILLFNMNTTTNNRPVVFSEDSVCPNELFSVREKSELQVCQWNKHGAIHPIGFRFLNFDKPIFALDNQTEIDIILNKCYDLFNKKSNGTARCMARMGQFMRAAGDAAICMRRQSLSMSLCDPLCDRNLFAMTPPQDASLPTRLNISMMAARMDVFSSFTVSNGGDISALTSVVALLAVADAIGRNLDEFVKQSNVSGSQLLISFLHGESMGYIGSSRMMWEMARNEFPFPADAYSASDHNAKQIRPDDLFSFIEVQQLEPGEAFYLHSSFEVYGRNRTLLDRIVKSISKSVSTHNFTLQFNKDRSVPFPPSSYHSILKSSILHNSTFVPGLLLTSYNGSFTNRYFNSIFDTDVTDHPMGKRQASAYIVAAAQALLDVALDHVQMIDEKTRQQFNVSDYYVNELLDCFFYASEWNCPLFQKLLNTTDLTKQYMNVRYLFIGTMDNSLIRILIHALLVRSLGEKSPALNVSTESQCNDLNKNQNTYRFVWQNDIETGKPLCYRTSIYVTKAKSPAFEQESYDFTSGVYSTWVESSRNAHGILELYLKLDIWLEVYASVTALLMILGGFALQNTLKEEWFIDNYKWVSAPRQL